MYNLRYKSLVYHNYINQGMIFLSLQIMHTVFNIKKVLLMCIYKRRPEWI